MSMSLNLRARHQLFFNLGELCIPGKYFINTIMLYWCGYRVSIEPLHDSAIISVYIVLLCYIIEVLFARYIGQQ